MIFAIFLELTLFLTINPSVLGEINDTVDKLVLIPEELAKFVLELAAVNKDKLGWQQRTKKPNYYVASSEITTGKYDEVKYTFIYLFITVCVSPCFFKLNYSRTCP